jgi:hypothetical protein
MKLLIPIQDLDSKRNQDPVPLECLQCGKTHYRTKNEVRRILKGTSCSKNRGCYCSHECKHKASRTIKSKYTCKQCGCDVYRYPSDILKTGNVFCSRSCSAKYRNRNAPNRGMVPLNTTCICLGCGKSYIARKNTSGKYCNLKCQQVHRQSILFNQIKNGTYPSKDPRQFKLYLESINSHKCEMCGLTEWGNLPILLILDHINGNSQDCSISNLRLICSNCDTLTPTYKNRNRGNGRHSRRERYKNGLSY